MTATTPRTFHQADGNSHTCTHPRTPTWVTAVSQSGRTAPHSMSLSRSGGHFVRVPTVRAASMCTHRQRPSGRRTTRVTRAAAMITLAPLKKTTREGGRVWRMGSRCANAGQSTRLIGVAPGKRK